MTSSLMISTQTDTDTSKLVESRMAGSSGFRWERSMKGADPVEPMGTGCSTATKRLPGVALDPILGGMVMVVV